MCFRKNFEELIFSARGQILKKRFSQNVSFYILNKTSVLDFPIFAHTIFEKLIKNDYFNYFSTAVQYRTYSRTTSTE